MIKIGAGQVFDTAWLLLEDLHKRSLHHDPMHEPIILLCVSPICRGIEANFTH